MTTNMTTQNLFKKILEIEVSRLHPYSVKGRPRLLHFEEAFDSIVRVVRTGMQWRQLRPPTVSYMTVFKTMHLWMKAKVWVDQLS